MWEATFDMALNNGLWAALFVALMVYVLRDTYKREKKYQHLHEENQKVILQLAENLRIVKEIKKDIDDIKGKIKSGKTKKQKRVIQRTVNRNSFAGAGSEQCGNSSCTDGNRGNHSGECDVNRCRSNNITQ